MRDRAKSRRYSTEKEAFRREHELHRAWGLVQRHSRKLRELHGGDGIVALTAAMLGRAGHACALPTAEPPQPPQPPQQPQPMEGPPVGRPFSAERSPRVPEKDVPSPATEHPPNPATEHAPSPVAERSTAPIPARRDDGGMEGSLPTKVDRTTIRSPIRRRHIDRGVFRCGSDSHTIPKSRCRKPLFSAVGERRDGRHPP
jgi:hypothetical protein